MGEGARGFPALPVQRGIINAGLASSSSSRPPSQGPLSVGKLMQEQNLPEPSAPVIIQQRIPNFSANAVASAMQPFSRSS